MKKLWTSLANYPPKNDPEAAKAVGTLVRRDPDWDEFLDDNTLEATTSRRDFLKLFGFSIATAAVAASCEQPVRKAIPYLIRPDEITPGKASYYASTFADGADYCSVLVKVRDGRPIKIEGNPLSAITRGGTSARVQASVLNLYDEARYKHPLISGKQADWEQLDKEVTASLDALNRAGRKVVLLTASLVSPSSLKLIEEFQQKFPVVAHCTYDAVSYSAMLEANQRVFGLELIPSYRFDKARLIVSFGADFLGTWLSTVEFTRQYAEGRSLTEGQQSISRHIQFESRLSLTGSNADERVLLKPSQEKQTLTALYNLLAARLGKEPYEDVQAPVNLDMLSRVLLENRGQSLVVSGSNEVSIQLLVNGINALLENYTTTIDLANPFLIKQGKDADMAGFVSDLENGNLGGVLFWDVNPVYDHPQGRMLKEAIEKLELSVSLSETCTETAAACRFVAPASHYLEAWDDAAVRPGSFSLAQPCIRPLFNTRQPQDSLLTWAGHTADYHGYIRQYWKENIYPVSGKVDFDTFWNTALRDGVFVTNPNPLLRPEFNTQALDEVLHAHPAVEAGFELELYEKTAIGAGRYSNNPWLQELPDPITKATWDNYLCVAPRDAAEQGWTDGDLLRIDDQITLPVLVQPGQMPGTLSAAVGYGRVVAGRVAEGVGQNVAPLIHPDNGIRQRWNVVASIQKVGQGYPIARTQTHTSMEGRDIIREASLREFLKNPSAGNEIQANAEIQRATLYQQYEYKGHHWGLAIDLNKCTGCSTCLVACSAENNVPVVGKEEVLRVHEMHWIRIDRYYEGSADQPRVYRQPVLCQHCDNAPCENVCPVAATNHSNEGLNQMAYNRCIGTRYCNNNCPYKVRRFNWFDYTMADSFKGNTRDPAGMTHDLKRMVLNPDVTVRSKGVIEKCSFCVQRIQEKKLEAKLENHPLADGEIQTACQQACPARALVFGDLNDKDSQVFRMFSDRRKYHLLEELNTLPSIGYLTRISHRGEKSILS